MAKSLTNRNIERGLRAAERLRPGTLLFSGYSIKCALGNKTFFEKLRADGGGFITMESQFINILRSDIPTFPGPGGVQVPLQFRRGQSAQVRNDDPDAIIPNEIFSGVIGEHNQLTTMVLMLNIESLEK